MRTVVFFLILFLAMPPAAWAELREEKKTDEKGAVTRTVYDDDMPVSTEIDVNADGTPDKVISFIKGKRHIERGDRNLDGKTDYERLHNSKGSMIQELRDSNADEKWDSFATFPQGTREIVLRETDRNFDGKIDRRSYEMWDANKSIVVPQATGFSRTPVPGYSVVWAEEDDDYDGIIDQYRNREDKTKDLKGKKMNVEHAAVPQEASKKKSVSTKTRSELHVEQLNKDYGYTK